MRWATEDDLSGTGAVTASDETFMVKVGDDVGRCSAKFFKDQAHLRGVVEGLVSSGNRVWLYVPLHDCNYQHSTNEIVACLCLRGPEGSEPDIADEMAELLVECRNTLTDLLNQHPSAFTEHGLKEMKKRLTRIDEVLEKF